MQLLALLVLLPLVRATPPNIPSADTAFSLLDTLSVEDWSWEGTYKRSEYGDGWKTVKGACNTRETVLKRDGKDVVVNPSTCAAVSGVWYSPYDGATWIKADDIDIDHLVPLSHSWKCGASHWTSAQRIAFANDLNNPQLLAVTDNVNQGKGDDAPEDYKPQLESYHCTYAKMWVKVKSVYSLSMRPEEKDAVLEMLNTCEEGDSQEVEL